MMDLPFGWLLLVAVLSVSTAGQSCHEPTDPDPYLYFSHKTAYQLIYSSKYKPVPYCRPTFVWMFIRHGTSYPNSNESLAIRQLHQFKDRIIKNHEERGNGFQCKSVIDSLKRWEFEVNPNSEDDISPQGRMDMQLMAKRIKDNMKEVIMKDINQNTFKIYSSEDRKVMKSAEEFTKTMFGEDYKTKVSIEKVPENSSFIGLESCLKWTSADHDSELSLFRETPDYKLMVSRISKRLGFLNDINDSIIHAMYESCRYNKALVLESYPVWCGLFNSHELKFLEYFEDLDYYYKYGYGSEMNVKVGCPIARELMDYLRAAANNDSERPSAVFRFGTSAGLLTTLLSLGIVRDSVPLSHSNYHAQYRRQWRMSQVDPFAGNLAVVFYKCDQSDEENKVMFYLNEGVYDYPGCNVGLCSWKFVEKMFDDRLTPGGCSDVCNDKSSASAKLNVVPIIALSTLVLALARR